MPCDARSLNFTDILCKLLKPQVAWYDRAAMAAAAERAARSLRLQREGSSSSSGVQIKVWDYEYLTAYFLSSSSGLRQSSQC